MFLTRAARYYCLNNGHAAKLLLLPPHRPDQVLLNCTHFRHNGTSNRSADAHTLMIRLGPSSISLPCLISSAWILPSIQSLFPGAASSAHPAFGTRVLVNVHDKPQCDCGSMSTPYPKLAKTVLHVCPHLSNQKGCWCGYRPESSLTLAALTPNMRDLNRPSWTLG
jgi:hypothetical protein